MIIELQLRKYVPDEKIKFAIASETGAIFLSIKASILKALAC